MRKNLGFSTISLLIGLLILVAICGLAYSRIQSRETQSSSEIITVAQDEKTSFSFTAAGDFSSNASADTVLRGIGQENSAFTLALGDLGYGGNGTEQEWCDFVTERVSTEHPFELVAGNHDDGSADGDISAYAKCLPDKIGNIIGTYGIEYYFDYNDLARVIMISPDINNYGFDYKDGSEHLQWVVNAVNEARSIGIDWVVLGMHKNCITPGEKTCEIGDDLLNTAVDLKIDLVLQGHEHAYFRSKQLALNKDTCPAIIVNSYNQSCVVDEDSSFKKGEGTIIVISGAGGQTLRNVAKNDPETEYFGAINGLNTGNTYGFSKFVVSSEEVIASFIPTSGAFTDVFSIRKN